MKKVAELFSEWLEKHEIIENADKDLYTYGFWQGSILLFEFLSIAVIGIMMDMFWYSIVFTISYSLLRSVSGGFHARTQTKCYIYSMMLLIFALTILRCEQWNALICIIGIFVSGIVVFKLAPVEDENKPLDDKETAVYKYRSRIIYGILAIITLILILLNKIQSASCMVISILSVSLLLILGKLRNQYIKQEKIM